MDECGAIIITPENDLADILPEMYPFKYEPSTIGDCIAISAEKGDEMSNMVVSYGHLYCPHCRDPVAACCRLCYAAKAIKCEMCKCMDMRASHFMTCTGFSTMFTKWHVELAFEEHDAEYRHRLAYDPMCPPQILRTPPAADVKSSWIPLQKYHKHMQYLACGMNGIVFSARYTHLEKVVIKVMGSRNCESKYDIIARNELFCMLRMQKLPSPLRMHTMILYEWTRFHGWLDKFRQRDKLPWQFQNVRSWQMMVMERADGTMQDLMMKQIHKMTPDAKEDTLRAYIVQLYSVCGLLHRRMRFCHNDLKANNVFYRNAPLQLQNKRIYYACRHNSLTNMTLVVWSELSSLDNRVLVFGDFSISSFEYINGRNQKKRAHPFDVEFEHFSLYDNFDLIFPITSLIKEPLLSELGPKVNQLIEYLRRHHLPFLLYEPLNVMEKHEFFAPCRAWMTADELDTLRTTQLLIEDSPLTKDEQSCLWK